MIDIITLIKILIIFETTILKQEKNELKELLSTLKLDNKFEKKIFQKLRYDDNYHINEVINALRIGKELINGAINNAFLAPMQSGKTGTIKHLCNLILPAIGFINDDESILFLTSMTDKDLKEQNMRALEGYDSKIFVMPMHRFKSSGILEIKKNKVKLIVRDEDQYGCGKDSSFDISFFGNARELDPDIPLLSVSATPFDVLDAKTKNIKVNLIEGMRHENYFGVTEMLNNGLVTDLPNNYQHFKVQNDSSIISSEIQKSIFHLRKYESGIGIIRCSDTKQALELKSHLSGLNKEGFETILIGCKTDITDYSIQQGLSVLPRKIRVEKKKIILLVIHALSAGKDLKKLKNDVKFIIETRKTQVANCVQGLPGRICGYHLNRDILIFANKTILEYFSDFENNTSLYNDEEWINELYFDEKVKTISTQTRLSLEQKEGFYNPIEYVVEISVEDLFNSSGEKHLDFLNPKEYEKLLMYFEKDQYDNKIKVGGLQNSEIQLRVASNYKQYNTVFKSWKKTLGDNFRGLFSHKNKMPKFGILISNYPVGDKRNKINFCGVKLFVPGEEIHLNRLSKTTNHSMYCK